MKQFAVLLTETRDLWYYLEAEDDESAMDEAMAIHKDWVDDNDIYFRASGRQSGAVDEPRMPAPPVRPVL